MFSQIQLTRQIFKCFGSWSIFLFNSPELASGDKSAIHVVTRATTISAGIPPAFLDIILGKQALVVRSTLP
jgi:hypothetical protein